MNFLSDEAIEQIAKKYVVSNTPSYLYKHFRQRDEIKELADNYSSEELINLILQIDNKNNLSLKDVVIGYAATVALTFHNLDEVKAATEEIEINKLEWVGRILHLWSEKFLHTINITIKSKPTIKTDIEGSRVNSSATEAHFRGSPRISMERVNEINDESSSTIISISGGD